MCHRMMKYYDDADWQLAICTHPPKYLFTVASAKVHPTRPASVPTARYSEWPC